MKTVLVTGGAKGIGAEITKLFAKSGYTVLLNYCHSEQQAQKLCKELNDEGKDVHLFKCDVTDDNSVLEMFSKIERTFHRLDCLINNAGVALNAQIQDVTEKAYDCVMDVNCRGAFLCCKYATRIFLNQDFGNILNVSSVWGLKGASCESVYSMSKHAIVGLTLSLHEELYLSGVRVNCLCPTLVDTDMIKNMSNEDISVFERKNGTTLKTAEYVAEQALKIVLGSDSGKIIEV